MNAIDFFQSPPQYSIFQKEINKTQYGGILFLIYLIIMFFISSAYIIDYAMNDKFEIEYYLVNSYYSKKSPGENAVGHFDPNINPETNFMIYVEIYYPISPYGIPEKNFSLEEIEKNLFLEYNGNLYKGKYSSKSSEFSYFIFNVTKKIFEYEKNNNLNIIYKCYDKTCSNFLKDTFMNIYITTQNFEIIHNASEPIKKSECLPEMDDPGNTTSCNYFISSNFIDEHTLYLNFKLSSIL